MHRNLNLHPAGNRRILHLQCDTEMLSSLFQWDRPLNHLSNLDVLIIRLATINQIIRGLSPRKKENKYNNSIHQRHPDTSQQHTYASVLSDPAPSHCADHTLFLPSRFVMRDNMSVWPTQSLQMLPQQQNNLVSAQAMLAAALQQAAMTQTMW